MHECQLACRSEALMAASRSWRSSLYSCQTFIQFSFSQKHLEQSTSHQRHNTLLGQNFFFLKKNFVLVGYRLWPGLGKCFLFSFLIFFNKLAHFTLGWKALSALIYLYCMQKSSAHVLTTAESDKQRGGEREGLACLTTLRSIDKAGCSLLPDVSDRLSSVVPITVKRQQEVWNWSNVWV